MTVEKTSPIIAQQKGTLARDVLKIVSGTSFAQLLGVMVAPILTRLYTPEAFGVLALFTSLSTILGVIACMRYELSIMLPETYEEAANLLAVSLGGSLLISMLTFPAIWFGGNDLLRWLNATQLSDYLWLIPLTVFISGVFLALNYWNTRTKHFGRLAIAKVTTSATANSAMIAAGYAGYASGATLIGATIGGQAIATAVLGGQILHDDGKKLCRFIRWRYVLAGIIRHRKFPLYGTWAALLNSASWQLPALLLSNFFSPIVVGYYALGLRVLQRPISLLGGAMAQVFFQRAAEAQARGTLASLVEAVFRRLVIIGFFPMIMLTIIGEELCIAVFGSTWGASGKYMQILSIFMFFNFISSPLGQLFSVLEKQEVSSIVNLVLFFSRLGALLWGGSTGDIIFTLSLFSVSGVAVYGGYSLWICSAAGVSPKQWITVMVRSFLVSVGFLLPAWLICTMLELHGWSLLSVYGTVLVTYYTWAIMQEPELRAMLPRFAQTLSRPN